MPVSDPPTDPSAIDELLHVMSSESCRQVLYALQERGGTADVDDLREHLSERTTADTAEISVTLHHAALPKLDDYEVIDYDQDTERVRYDGDPFIAELLEWAGEKERKDG